ncbi:MAG: hypothetical protein K2Y05_02280 [Hyphomicrobiaceae bacterium]|nr:hypothetical protein [Hyphomicrobiaceae bacterium]
MSTGSDPTAAPATHAVSAAAPPSGSSESAKRDRDDDAPLFELFRPRPDDPKNIRNLRLAVMAMGVVLLALFMAVILRIGYLMTRDTARPTVSAAQAAVDGNSAAVARIVRLTPDVAVQLPPSARLKGHTLSGNRISLHYEAPAGEGIMVVDLETGQPASHIRLRSSN